MTFILEQTNIISIAKLRVLLPMNVTFMLSFIMDVFVNVDVMFVRNLYE